MHRSQSSRYCVKAPSGREKGVCESVKEGTVGFRPRKQFTVTVVHGVCEGAARAEAAADQGNWGGGGRRDFISCVW